MIEDMSSSPSLVFLSLSCLIRPLRAKTRGLLGISGGDGGSGGIRDGAAVGGNGERGFGIGDDGGSWWGGSLELGREGFGDLGCLSWKMWTGERERAQASTHEKKRKKRKKKEKELVFVSTWLGHLINCFISWNLHSAQGTFF